MIGLLYKKIAPVGRVPIPLAIKNRKFPWHDAMKIPQNWHDNTARIFDKIPDRIVSEEFI